MVVFRGVRGIVPAAAAATAAAHPRPVHVVLRRVGPVFGLVQMLLHVVRNVMEPKIHKFIHVDQITLFLCSVRKQGTFITGRIEQGFDVHHVLSVFMRVTAAVVEFLQDVSSMDHVGDGFVFCSVD